MEGMQWKDIKRELPGNYLQQIADRLKKQKVSLNPQQIRDIRRGKNKNPKLTRMVWQEIRNLIRESKKEKEIIKKLIQIANV
jgi:Cu2+-containing amine oxidase